MSVRNTLLLHAWNGLHVLVHTVNILPRCVHDMLVGCVAQDSGFPYIKMISPDKFVGMSETAKVSRITKIFEDVRDICVGVCDIVCDTIRDVACGAICDTPAT